jgi:hypothetical protein
VSAAVFKRGDTVSLTGTLVLPQGTFTHTCKAKSPQDGLVASLSVDVDALESPTDDATHSIVIVSTTDTSTWPRGLINLDVRSESDADPPVITHTDTFVIEMKDSITDA